MKNKKGHINAFTLFEVMMVLAIMGVLITIISLSLNRFQEQLKLTSEVQTELNNWYRFRANLWKELYHSDSLRMDSGSLNIYHQEHFVSYKVDEDSLYRKNAAEWESTGFTAEAIRMEENQENREYFFDIIWKNEIMTLSYLEHSTPKLKIDRYFEEL